MCKNECIKLVPTAIYSQVELDWFSLVSIVQTKENRFLFSSFEHIEFKEKKTSFQMSESEDFESLKVLELQNELKEIGVQSQ